MRWQARRLNVEEDMRPVVECLRLCDLNQAQIVKVSSSNLALEVLSSL